MFAQKSGSVKGIVFDTISKQPVSAATIIVLQQKDSSLVTFTMTSGNGSFSLTNLSYGDYRLLITHVGYHNSSKYFSVSENNKNIDLGNVVLSGKTKVLEELELIAEATPVTLIFRIIYSDSENEIWCRVRNSFILSTCTQSPTCKKG